MSVGAKRKGLNNYEIRGDVTAIFLENKKGVKQETLVDTEDLQRLIKLGYHWHLKWSRNVSSYYAQTTVYLGHYKYKLFYLHNLVMDTEPYVKLDHRNHNTLDNTKNNLRIIDDLLNQKNRKGRNSNNTTGVRNVSWAGKTIQRYLVQFQVNKKNVCFGRFKEDEFDKAVELANIKRKEIYGEFAGEE
jgi:hypothetical protein